MPNERILNPCQYKIGKHHEENHRWSWGFVPIQPMIPPHRQYPLLSLASHITFAGLTHLLDVFQCRCPVALFSIETQLPHNKLIPGILELRNFIICILLVFMFLFYWLKPSMAVLHYIPVCSRSFFLSSIWKTRNYIKIKKKYEPELKKGRENHYLIS